MSLFARFSTLSQPTPQMGRWDGSYLHGETGTFTLEEVTLLPPATPTKIIGVGRNYRDHAQELGNAVPAEPLLFMKASSALIATGAPIILPASSQRVDYEGELAVIIGKVTKNITVTEAPDYILGYTCANDVTARDFQKKDGQWIRAKGFDTFCPLGPFLYQGLLDPTMTLETRLNDKVVQSAPISAMVFSVEYLVAYVSAIMTLYPGDVILTGTPAGVGPLNAGDQVTVSIPELGSLTNSVCS